MRNVRDRTEAAAIRTAELIETAGATCNSSMNVRERSERLRIKGQQLRERSAHELMPLNLAVATIYRRVYLDLQVDIISNRQGAHLDGLAYSIAAMWPIYVYDDNGAKFRDLTGEEISQGLFRRGAKEIQFIDGRPPILNLAVNVSTIEAAVDVLRSSLVQSDGSSG